ncbi:shikimate dehydrogenase [Photobacterium proteolyticum]|uniref:Shikimate dehydrogenase n=1 Tax=Photobacterium proteolyticum TaxID=1903952 RepID=A0A1Q9GN38_9GAMM|nr:acetyltransferase [Photobacterium proteolyticum]OLQ76074.1 shikimate dehydrogenase [Photobacterium proteolyticum]
MKNQLIIIGAGGFAKSVVDSINFTTEEIVGFIDSYKQGEHLGIPILGASLNEIDDKDKYVYFISIGDPKARLFWYNELEKRNLQQINIIDPTAIVSRTVELGTGIYIGKMCIVNSGTVIHDGAVLNTRTLIEHGNQIGFCANISTNVVLNGDVQVGKCTFVGSCTVVNGQLNIGNESIVGSGSVVIRDIPNNVVVAGSPTRLIRDID